MKLLTIQHKDKDTAARTGIVRLKHGEVRTPTFMPVGTQATVKAMKPEELAEVGTDCILVNTYHMYLRPGAGLIKRAGGLHRFMNWKGCIITDSGGFQVFSLSQLRKINDEGVEFQSHLDGSRHVFNAEKSIEVQLKLGADIIMSFDECPPYPFESDQIKTAVERTATWAERGKKFWQDAGGPETGCQLFGIMQGGADEEMRRISAEHLVSLDLPGYAIGGVSVGEPREERYKAFEIAAPLLPEDKPRYLMGVGTPEDLLEAIGRGIDMFDCVMPTRNARNGMAFTSRGRLVIRNSRYTEDLEPIDPACNCYVCANYSRAYLRHMFMSREILGSHLLTYHNIAYYQHLMDGARSAIAEGRFPEWRRSVLSALQEESEENPE